MNQLLAAANSQAAAEALALALELECDLEALLPLLEASWGHSTMLQRSGGLVAAAARVEDLPFEALGGATFRGCVAVT